MINGNRQRKGLETLKLINAAATALRLYPAASLKVSNSIEDAYHGVKSYVRKYGLFRFSRPDGDYLFDGEPVDKPTKERLHLLTFNDHLVTIGLTELVLDKGLDRKIFKKILSTFTATPEQIKKAGGGEVFIKRQQLNEVFPQEYIAEGESKEEQEQKQKTEKVLKELAGSYVHPEELQYLFGKKKEKTLHQQIAAKFQTPDVAAHVIATATFSLLQILQKHKSVSVSPVFGRLLEKVDLFIQETGRDEREKYGQTAAALLVPSLDDSSVMMFLCQDFSTPFGSLFYDAVTSLVESKRMTRVFEWMKLRYEKQEVAPSEATVQVKVIAKAYTHFVNSSRAKQIVATGTARELLAKTEEGRKTKRIQAGLMALADGNMQSLQSKEVCQSLPSTISKLLKNEKESLAAAIIQNVVNGLKEESNESRSCYAAIIGGVTEKLIVLERWDWAEKLTPVCLAWLREVKIVDPCLHRHVQSLQSMMTHAWGADNDDLAERILNVFYHIRSGALGSPEEVRNLVAQVQDENVDLVILQSYLDACFVKPVDEIICRKITMQGPVAARFLLDTLITSERRPDRIRLLKLLGQAGKELVPVLLERLPDSMPWYGKRNIIRLLGKTGSEKDCTAVLEYLSHEDLRVQQETLRCVVQIGVSSITPCLLQVLPDVGLRMKVQIVKALFRSADETVVPPLAELLEDCKLYKGESRDVLAEEICHTLGGSGSAKAFPVLQGVLDNAGKLFAKTTVETAENAISYIQERGHSENRPKNRPPETDETALERNERLKNAAKYENITGSPAEQQVYELLKKDKIESAKKVLLECIEDNANRKRFAEAEAQRLRLIEIDPQALTEIIQAAGYIEDVKAIAVDHDHITIWSEFYDLLTTQEFNTFYSALKHAKYPVESVVVKQGDPQWSLFFINKGRVKLFYLDKENETLVKTLKGGEILGGESFFNHSAWTLNATTMGNVEISILSRENVEEWSDVYPALEEKIREYCDRAGQESEFFLVTGANRREEERSTFTKTVSIDLLDEGGKTTETTIHGNGYDISSGGLSFISNIERRKQVSQLLGWQVNIRFVDAAGSVINFQEVTGRIVAVRNLHSAGMGRSVHISFDTKMEQNALVQLGYSLEKLSEPGRS